MVGCSPKEELPLLDAGKTLDEKVIKHRVEKIILSKGFQSTEPMVEASKEGGKLKLIVTAGVIECSGINIDKVTRAGNTISLYISGLFERDKIKLAIPQATVIIDEVIDSNINDLNFNIVSQNYKAISLKYNKNQIIDKIRGEFKIDLNTIPQVELVKDGDNIYWDMLFVSLIHKDNHKSPLSNLTVKADAISGEILDYEKSAISTYIDQGYLMDYLPNELILYKKVHTDNDIQYESLWTYDIGSYKKTKIYTTKYSIQSAYFNPVGEHISLIEKDDSKSDVYIIEMSKNIAYKVTPPEYFHPKLIRWKNNNELSIADVNGEKSTIFTYDIVENRLVKEFEVDKVISSFDVFDNMIVFSEVDELAINKNIYLTDDGLNLKQVGSGFSPSFFNKKNIIYLENDKDNKNILKMYDIEKNNIVDRLNYNIVSYKKLDDETIIFIENTNFNNEYSLIKYLVDSRSIASTYRVSSPSLYYSSEKEKAYMSLAISGNGESLNNIYCIDLKEVSILN